MKKHLSAGLIIPEPSGLMREAIEDDVQRVTVMKPPVDQEELGFLEFCERCKKGVVGEAILCDSKYFHPKCFHPDTDRKPTPSPMRLIKMKRRSSLESFDRDRFREQEVMIKRVDDGRKTENKTCSLCKEVIFGEMVIAGESHFHKNCFVCKACGEQLENSPLSYVIVSGTPFHEICYENLL